MGDNLHRPVRRWRSLWRRACHCGVSRWPCPDALPADWPTPAELLGLHGR